MSTERLIPGGHEQAAAADRIFEELPTARILSVSRPDASDITPLLLSFTIQLQYKQFKWQLLKKASQVIYLHFALNKRAIVEELHEKQEQVRDWLQNIAVHDEDEPDDGDMPIYNDDSVKSRCVPSRAALSIIRPAIGRQRTVSERAKAAMQGYLNHFLGNLDIVNSREVCKFLGVSRLSFSQEYGPKMKEGYVMVKHLPMSSEDNIVCSGCCCLCHLSGCCGNNWRKVWLVLKPGFLAFLENHFDTKLLDIAVFDVLATSSAKGDDEVHLAKVLKERNPLRHAFQVSCGNRIIKIRTTTRAKIEEWVSAINAVGPKRSESWCRPHRFDSFAPTRGMVEDGSLAQWFIDGKAAFEAIASSIESAKSEIYMTGWWLCPELYLRRPFDSQSSSRLDVLLEAKAKEGVQIYILLYKEVSLALKINSMYSKRKLLNIHENVKVLRYPDHLSCGIYFCWCMQVAPRKLVIVDHKICFIGGLDLCFGRYDTTEHKVGDLPPYIFPGKDYYNPRESEPDCWEDALKDELDRKKYPRMPWHDVHCAVWGPPCRDIARHFIQRWNHSKRSKAPNEEKIPLLMPQHHMVLPHYMGIDIFEEKMSREDSFSSETPPDDIPLLLPHEANCDDFVDSNNNNTNLQSESLMKVDSEFGYCRETPDVNFQVISANEVTQVGPRSLCRCQVIRSVSQWSAGTSQTEDSIHRAYCALIDEAEYFIYIENQFFISGLSEDEVIQNRVLESLYNRIMRAHREKSCFRVIIVIPLLPGFQGGVDDIGAASVRAVMHWQYRTICRGESSILQKLCSKLGSVTHDFISFFGLRNYGTLFDGGPVVTSQVYVHSKVMIVDDRCALIGSSNINDRSLLGSRDSEIAVLIEDKEFVDSSMDGNPWKAGNFSYNLRLCLWAEHLGLNAEEVTHIKDPIAGVTYKDLWLHIAKANTKIYQDVFSCIPNDTIRSRYALRQSVSHWKQKLGHTTIDLGVAPEKVEFDEDGEAIDTRLKSLRGHLVCFPLEFMRQEDDLRPMFIESEFYASPQVFH